MASLDSYTVGVITEFPGPTTRVSFTLKEKNGQSTSWRFARAHALDLAARLIQACTAVEPIDLTDIVKEATSG